MTFESILIIIAGIVGVAVVGFVAIYFLGFIDWMNRGSH